MILATGSRRSTVAAEAHVEVVRQKEDGVKPEDATEDAAAENNDELDIQLDEDVSPQPYEACHTHCCSCAALPTAVP